MAIAKTGKPASVAVNQQLPKGKQTTPGLYVTAQEAFEKMRNGWKNSGLPWVYGIDPDKMTLEEAASKPTQ